MNSSIKINFLNLRRIKVIQIVLLKKVFFYLDLATCLVFDSTQVLHGWAPVDRKKNIYFYSDFNQIINMVCINCFHCTHLGGNILASSQTRDSFRCFKKKIWETPLMRERIWIHVFSDDSFSSSSNSRNFLSKSVIVGAIWICVWIR